MFLASTARIILSVMLVSNSYAHLLLQVDMESTVGVEAFSRIAPAIPTIADVITCFNLFDVLSTSSGGRLSFAVYEKYLVELERL